MAVQMPGEDLLAQRDRRGLVHRVEAQAVPGRRSHLDDEGREISVEAIGMGPDPARLGFLEGEGEGVEHLAGAEPEELVPAHLDIDVEMLGMRVADAAVGAIGGDDEIIVRPVGQVRPRLVLEMQHHAQLAGPRLQDRQQPLAADADKAVPA